MKCPHCGKKIMKIIHEGIEKYIEIEEDKNGYNYNLHECHVAVVHGYDKFKNRRDK